jgi:branched-chain amino acid transport system ATP-binding protein
MTVVWIEHIVHALLAVVDRLMCLAGGKILAIGDPREVMASPAVVEVYLGTTFDLEETA